MLLTEATEADHDAIVELANAAYRGPAHGAAWCTEGDILGGQRLDRDTLRQDLAAKPAAHLLTLRDQPGGPLLGTVWLEPKSPDVWYLGLLTVRPDLQNRQLGRHLLAAAETFAGEHGARKIQMTVIQVRGTLIAWYGRRGYSPTGATEPFPYGQERFGKPLRDDLHFVVLEKIL